jgi:hypothetical protein
MPAAELPSRAKHLDLPMPTLLLKLSLPAPNAISESTIKAAGDDSALQTHMVSISALCPYVDRFLVGRV